MQLIFHCERKKVQNFLEFLQGEGREGGICVDSDKDCD